VDGEPVTRVPLATRFRIGADYLDGEKFEVLVAKYETPHSTIQYILRKLGIPPRTRVTDRHLARQGKPRMYRRWP
jgi:hypothetical protein